MNVLVFFIAMVAGVAFNKILGFSDMAIIAGAIASTISYIILFK
jgi:hypothetical protein